MTAEQTLDFIQCQALHYGSAMGAVALEINLIQLCKQGLDLYHVQGLVRSDHAVTSHHDKDVVDGIPYIPGPPDALQLKGHIHHQCGGGLLSQQLGYRLEGKGFTPEGFNLKPEALQFLGLLLQCYGTVEIKLQNVWKQERLAGDRITIITGPELLKADPFMGGMLIDQNQVVAVLTEDITLMILTEHAQAAEKTELSGNGELLLGLFLFCCAR